MWARVEPPHDGGSEGAEVLELGQRGTRTWANSARGGEPSVVWTFVTCELSGNGRVRKDSDCIRRAGDYPLVRGWFSFLLASRASGGGAYTQGTGASATASPASPSSRGSSRSASNSRSISWIAAGHLVSRIRTARDGVSPTRSSRGCTGGLGKARTGQPGGMVEEGRGTGTYRRAPIKGRFAA